MVSRTYCTASVLLPCSKSSFWLAHDCMMMGVSLCNRLMASSLEKSWNRGLKVGFTAKCDVIYELRLSCLDEARPLSANNICLFIIILNQHKYEHVLECARPYDSVISDSSRMSKAFRVLPIVKYLQILRCCMRQNVNSKRLCTGQFPRPLVPAVGFQSPSLAYVG